MIFIIFSAALRSAVGGILAEALFRILRIEHPAMRKAVWGCVLASSLAMPLLQAYSVHLGVPVHDVHLLQQHIEGTGALHSFAMSIGDGHVNSQTATPFVSRAFTPSLQAVLFSLYVLVAAALSLRIAVGLIRIWFVVRQSLPLEIPRLGNVRLSTEVSTPWTVFSTILLPADAVAWDSDQLSVVLAHESSHVRQGDFYLQLAARIYATLFWFSPFAWWLQRECERLGEQTSDCAALRSGTDARQYAAILLRFSTGERLPAVCMARRSELGARIDAILSRRTLLHLLDRPKNAALKAAVVCVFSVLAGHVALKGQSALDLKHPTVPFQKYDVVSVKPNKSTQSGMHLHTHDADFQATNISVKMLLTQAYGIRAGLIVGLPKWADSSRWDVYAKITEPNPALMNRTLSNQESNAIYRAQVQDMLAQSFHLKTHYETDTLPVYDLVVARAGSKLAPSTLPESQTGTDVHNYNMVASHLSMALFSQTLSNMLDRNVIDKTGLTGTYDFKLIWTPTDRLDAAKESGTNDLPPDIFTAVQEQLGLKLVPSKGPSEKLVVDSIEAPQSN